MAEHDPDLAELMPTTSAPVGTGIGINVRRLIMLRGQQMLLIFLAVLIPCAAAIFVLVPREYRAEATIEFRATAQTVYPEQARPISGTPAYESYVNTQLELIDGYTILSRVLRREDIRSLPALRGRDTGAVQFLMQHLEVVKEPLSELVSLHYRDERREDAVAILGAVLEEYESYAREQEESLRTKRRSALAETVSRYEAELEQQRTDIAALRKALEIPVGNLPGVEPTETESFRINLAQAEADIAKANAAMRQTENNIERTKNFIERHEKNPSAPVFAQNVEQEVNRDPNVLQLTEQLAKVQQEYSKLEETYVGDAPQMKVKQNELKGVEAKLEEVKGRARGAALRSLLAQHEYELTVHQGDLEDAKERRERFMRLIDEYRERNLELGRGLADINELERRYDDTRALLAEARSQIHLLDLEALAPARASVGEPVVAGTPESGRRLKAWLLATVFAGVLAVGFGVLRELMDQSIRSGEDVAYVSNVPVIASIPHCSEDRLPENVHMETVTRDYPASFTADEYRRAMSRVLHGGRGGREARVCMVASPARGDGKTTLACNLAIVLAQAGRRVLLVDVDSRNPEVERSFGLRPAPGLAEMLTGETLAHDPDRNTGYENLSVLGPGLRSQDLLELLASHAMQDFITGAQEVFDHIIIDSPASLLMSETRLLAPLADGVLIVTGVGVTTFGMLRRMLRATHDAGGHIIGVVVNGLKQSPGGYLKANLESYYAQNKDGRRGVGATRMATGTRPRSTEPSIVLVPEEKRQA